MNESTAQVIDRHALAESELRGEIGEEEEEETRVVVAAVVVETEAEAGTEGEEELAIGRRFLAGGDADADADANGL